MTVRMKVMAARALVAGVIAGVVASFALVASPAEAHIERPAYWPNPAQDCSISPCAGGKVPKTRGLYTALDTAPPGKTRVVCRGSSTDPASTNASMVALRASIAAATTTGYTFRPSVPKKVLSADAAKKLKDFNVRLLRACTYNSIQDAVTDSHNNDRVVIMPGLYTEPKSREKLKFDPACDKYEGYSDFPRSGGAATYKYHYHCPNDANLIAVMGRAPGGAAPPDPPLLDRRGIPDAGACIRCNLQIEGSGVTAQDVVIEAGDPAMGNQGPAGERSAKDVGITAQRADGFVLRMVTVRHAKEHGIYVMETDGFRLERFQAFYSGLYGTLTFVSDHGLHTECATAGHGDSGVYPGAPPETGEQRDIKTEPVMRYNNEITRCDSYHNLAGYSATSGNAVWVHDNNFYDNALGLQTDVVTAAGHPGFPDDSQLIEDNNFYSNNFNPYLPDSDVPARFPFPVGTGMWIAGGNNHTVRNNHFWDNWRRGAMLFAVPDILVCGPQTGNTDQAGCNATSLSTSHRNKFHGNVMGKNPRTGAAEPNGVDFWWDSFLGNRENCWWGNTSPTGKVTTSPALPNCANGTNPALSIGLSNIVHEGELLQCFLGYETGIDLLPCPWMTTPPKPGASGSPTSAAEKEQFKDAYREFCDSDPSASVCATAD